MIARIGREALKAKLDRGEKLVLVEALPAKYFRHAHLPGAVNIPPDEIDALAPRLLPDKEAEIVVYCAEGPCRNSEIAAARLTELGYANVRDYHEGKADWIKAGYPVEKGEEPALSPAAAPSR